MSVERTQTMFDYVDRTGIRMMPFIRVPKYLLEDPFFQVLSVEAILLYSILLDRLELSLCNDWFDEHGHAYVIYRLLRELDEEHGIGLIERIRVGQCQPSIIYVKVYSPENRPHEVGKADFRMSENQTSEGRKSRLSDIEKSDASKTDCNETERNETERVKVRHRHGAYHNVLLTDEEMEKLRTEFPRDYEERIERLSEYIASKGARYKNHLATIRSWDRRERREREQRFRQENYETEDTL